MLTLIITPRRGLYPSLACFEEDKICYDYEDGVMRSTH